MPIGAEAANILPHCGGRRFWCQPLAHTLVVRRRGSLRLCSKGGNVLSWGCSHGRRGKRGVIQPLGALMAFINSFARQQCIIEAGATPRDVHHHPSRVWQLWRTKQWSAKRAEVAGHDGRQHRDRTSHEDDSF